MDSNKGSQSWSDYLYNGLVVETGAQPKVASSMVTKPNRTEQLSEIMAPQLDITSNNDRNRGLRKQSKQQFSVHRALSFLPQE